jgi:hypothetical protein
MDFYISTCAIGSLLLGVSWFVGMGNMDAGIHIGKEISGSIGYTMMLGKKNGK